MALAIKTTKTSSKVSLAGPARLVRARVTLERILDGLLAGGLSILLALPQAGASQTLCPAAGSPERRLMKG